MSCCSDNILPAGGANLTSWFSTRSHPFLYFPVFYSMKAGVEGKPLSYAVSACTALHTIRKPVPPCATVLSCR